MAEVKFPFDVDRLFDRCVRNKLFPRNGFNKQVVLIRLVEMFGDDRRYLESEINEKVERYFDDTGLIMRELVN